MHLNYYMVAEVAYSHNFNSQRTLEHPKTQNVIIEITSSQKTKHFKQYFFMGNTIKMLRRYFTTFFPK